MSLSEEIVALVGCFYSPVVKNLCSYLSCFSQVGKMQKVNAASKLTKPFSHLIKCSGSFIDAEKILRMGRESPQMLKNMKPNSGNFTYGSSVDLNDFGDFMGCI